MNTIYKKNMMYMSDEESFVATEFDIMDDSLVYTLDFNTKGKPSIFSNVYDTEHQRDLWSITIERDNLFYPALLELLGDLSTVIFRDEKDELRFVKISIQEDLRIILSFYVPGNQYNVVNIKLSKEDPNYERFIDLITSLKQTFKNNQQSKRKRP
jgi:hypothetical protein